MCDSCWDDYGRPTHSSPTIERAAELTRRLYVFEPTGGPLHIVTDDWNLADGYVRFCQDEAATWKYDAGFTTLTVEDFTEAKAIAQELAALLLTIPEVDRAATLARLS